MFADLLRYGLISSNKDYCYKSDTGFSIANKLEIRISKYETILNTKIQNFKTKAFKKTFLNAFYRSHSL